jgi:hypothetical protein
LIHPGSGLPSIKLGDILNGRPSASSTSGMSISLSVLIYTVTSLKDMPPEKKGGLLISVTENWKFVCNFESVN